MAPSDWDLVQRVRAGNRDAFRELVERYQARIAALALGMLRHREDALDVVQETFTRAYESLDRFKGDATFYSGTTAAYPLPHPGDGPAPKPVTLPAGALHDALGIHEVSYTKGQQALMLKEQKLQ